MTDSTPLVTYGVLVCSDGTRQTLKRWETPVVFAIGLATIAAALVVCSITAFVYNTYHKK